MRYRINDRWTLISDRKPDITYIKPTTKADVDKDHRDKKQWMRVTQEEWDLVMSYRAAKDS